MMKRLITKNTSKNNPVRKCVATNKHFPRSQMLRIVATKNKTIAVDYQQKLPGRGAYLSPSEINAELVFKRKKLNRALKIKVPPSIYTEIKNYCKEQNNAKNQKTKSS